MDNSTPDLIFFSVRPDEFYNRFREIIREEVKAKVEQELEEKYLSGEKARKLFDPEISRGTLHNWVKKGYIKKYDLNGRSCYKRSEIMEAAKEFKKYYRP